MIPFSKYFYALHFLPPDAGSMQPGIHLDPYSHIMARLHSQKISALNAVHQHRQLDLARQGIHCIHFPPVQWESDQNIPPAGCCEILRHFHRRNRDRRDARFSVQFRDTRRLMGLEMRAQDHVVLCSFGSHCINVGAGFLQIDQQCWLLNHIQNVLFHHVSFFAIINA